MPVKFFIFLLTVGLLCNNQQIYVMPQNNSCNQRQQQNSGNHSSNTLSKKMLETSCLLCSIVTFHISFLYNKIMHGAAFNYNLILNSTNTANSTNIKPMVTIRNTGEILDIYDGKKMPIVLGSIPCSTANFKQLESDYMSTTSNSICLYTFNRPFECRWAGLNEALQADAKHTVTQFRYQTTDFCAPSFIDLIRITRDLENRDAYSPSHSLAYIHCKAGRGRSAVALAAYLAYICFKVKVPITFDQIQTYIRSHRSHVNINRLQEKAFNTFYQALQEAGSLTALCQQYHTAISARDNEMNA